MPDPKDLYPLRFEPIYKEKVWGGRAFEKLGRALPGSASTGVGESWEIADLATTSVSGGGGNAEYSVVAEGPLKGKSIRELMQTYGEALLGEGVKPADDGGFPLLIKFLDAKENLSVQVHPSPEYAAAHPDAHLKSEAWYIIDAEPGAVIYKGLAPGVTPEQLRAALVTNTDEAVVPLLNAIEVKPGDCHYLPSGTLHALGAGVLVAEVQTPSDTTFRVYDWGRTDRELHIEQAMACIDFEPLVASTSTPSSYEDPLGRTRVVKASCEFFKIEEVTSNHGGYVDCATASACIVITLDGTFAMVHPDREVELDLATGQSALFPWGNQAWLISGEPGRKWLSVTMPHADR